MDYTHGGNVYKIAREKNIPVEKIIDFSANINPLGLSDIGNRRLKDAWRGLLHYPDPDYVALKEALASFHECKTEQVFLGNGAIDVIFFLMDSLRPQSALILAPTFVEYERALKAVESRVTPFYLKEEDGFQLNVETYLEEAMQHDCLILCNPNNPTGQLLAKKSMLDILTFAKAHDKKLVIDEAFMDFTDEEELNSCIDQLSAYDNLFILRSITKFFAVPGLRLGYLLTSNRAFREIYINKKAPWCVNHFAQEYTIGALEDRAYIEKSKAYIISEREYLYKMLKDIKDVFPYQSHGNYIFFKYDGQKNLKELLENEGILIRSCSNYRGLEACYFRVAVKTEGENRKLLASIKRLTNEIVD